jgi:CBS domain-containing protein
MGEHDVTETVDDGDVRAFTRSILADIRALETLLDREMLENDTRRVGVEQEMFIIDPRGYPLPIARALLAELSDARFTTELASFNFEANLPPRRLGGDFLNTIEAELEDVLETVSLAAERLGARVLITGILPTLRQEDLRFENLTPDPRFRQMNAALSRLRGGSFPVRIEGIDLFDVVHDSVMIESANTSLQLHLQVGPDEFARIYNLAQVVTAPLLAAATNSPLLLGRRLWHETRVALFERSLDDRSGAQLGRGLMSRVTFGDAWVENSALEIFRENLARFHVIMTRGGVPDPMTAIEQGVPPALSALALHNSTVWRWNRPCYGVNDGVAHLRIENRVLPAGPTVLDEVANAALFYGTMIALEHECPDVTKHMSFSDTRANFLAAAQHGIKAGFSWLDGRHVSARELLLEELIPAAREGLRRVETPEADIDRYLGVIEARVGASRTGSRWLLESLAAGDGKLTHDARLEGITKTMIARQASGRPVHEWELAPSNPGLRPPAHATRVRDIMSTNLFTVLPEDVVDLAASVMEWRHIRHVPVEDAAGRLVGMLSHRGLLKAYHDSGRDADPVPVERVMDRHPATVPPDTPLPEAMDSLLESDSGCLLVVSREHVVGIVTERDFVEAAAALLADGADQ